MLQHQAEGIKHFLDVIMPLLCASARRLVYPFLLLLAFHSRVALHAQTQNESPPVFQPHLGKLRGNPHYFMPYREPAHPRLGLALSGGGARCLAQIGVLQALEEEGAQIDFIAGTSMGGFVGGMYASGYSAGQLRAIVQEIAWDDIMKDTPPRKNLLLSQKQEPDRALLQMRFNGHKPAIPRALTAGQKLHSILTELTWKANYWASGSFDNLRIPFRAIATDVYSGEEVVLESGDLSEALRASGALPLLIAPVPKEDMLLVDGGVANNIPVDIVRRYGIELVIAVDATSNLRTKEHLSSPWEFADQVTTIMQQEKNARQRGAADVLISFEDLPRTSLDFTNLDALIQLGYERMREQLPKLRALQRGAEPQSEDETRHPIHAVRTQNGAHDFTLHAGRNGGALTARDIRRELDRLHASGDYQHVEARLARDTLTYALTRNPVLRAVRLRGNTVYPDSVLLRRLKSRLAAPFNHHQGKADLTAMIEHYRRDGYALAEIKDVRFDSASGELTITFDEGVVAHVAFEGLQRTQTLVALREFALRPGEIFNSKRARRGIDNIHSTGLFENVTLTPLRQAQGGVRLQIKVEEKAYNLARFGDYYRSERGNFAFLELGNDNLLGTGSKLFLRGGLGAREQEAKLSWRSDRIFKTFLTLAASAYHRKQDDIIYDRQALNLTLAKFSERRAGVRLALGQQLRGLGAVSAAIRWEEIHLEKLYGENFPSRTSQLTALALCSAVDTRDQLPFARGGRYANFCYEYGKLSAPESFVKFTAHLETFHSLGPHTLHAKGLSGFSDRTTPFSEQFRLGGPDQVFGLRDRQLIGRQFLLGSLAYRYQLRKRPFFDTYFTARYDVSGLWDDQEDASYKKFHHAWGFAVVWDTPLGPLGVALGWFENRQRRIYFNAGVAF